MSNPNALVDLTDLEMNYLLMLQSLLPSGPAWDKSFVTYNPDGSILTPQSNITTLLSGFAKEFARLHSRISDLVEEANPLTTYETIYAKYQEAGLPDPCVSAADGSIEGMRIDILHKWITVGGATMAFIANLLSASGYVYTLSENPQFHMNMPIGGPISSDGWAYAINVRVTGVNEVWFRANKSSSQDYLHTWQTNSVFCYINKIIPAHVVVNYTFA